MRTTSFPLPRPAHPGDSTVAPSRSRTRRDGTRLHRIVASAGLIAVALTGTIATAPPATAQDGYHIDTAGGPLTVRTGPGAGYAAAGTIADNTPVDISCQIHGTSVTGTYGTSTVWDKIGSGRYVADAYVFTGRTDKFLPTCDAAGSGRKLPAKLPLSAKGLSYIAKFEGFRATTYHDAGRNCTIGYGHLIHKGPCTAADRAKWGTISKARGRELLRSDTNRFVNGLRTQLKSTPLHQHEFDALVSFAYNIGLGDAKTGFYSSSVRKDLIAKPPRYSSVPAHMKPWDKSDGTSLCGLHKRRFNEGKLFRTGSYTISTPTCPYRAS